MRFLPAFLCLASFSAAGQDSHYWYSEFNPAGFLMPGAVIANNGDSGVYFYNPALWPYQAVNRLYQCQCVPVRIHQYQNGAGTGKDLKGTLANSVPLMLSGSIVLKTRKRPLTFAYALTRTPMAFQLHSDGMKSSRCWMIHTVRAQNTL
jgi:hypothetical protein